MTKPNELVLLDIDKDQLVNLLSHDLFTFLQQPHLIIYLFTSHAVSESLIKQCHKIIDQLKQHGITVTGVFTGTDLLWNMNLEEGMTKVEPLESLTSTVGQSYKDFDSLLANGNNVPPALMYRSKTITTLLSSLYRNQYGFITLHGLMLQFLLLKKPVDCEKIYVFTTQRAVVDSSFQAISDRRMGVLCPIDILQIKRGAFCYYPDKLRKEYHTNNLKRDYLYLIRVKTYKLL